MSLRAVCYARKSSSQEDRHDEAKSVTRQLEQGRQFAVSKGWQTVAEFVDDGLSGALDADKRPGLRAMLEAASAKQFDILLTALPDRIARDQWINAAIMARLAKANIRLFYFLTGREADLKTAAGKTIEIDTARADRRDNRQRTVGLPERIVGTMGRLVLPGLPVPRVGRGAAPLTVDDDEIVPVRGDRRRIPPYRNPSGQSVISYSS